ncbi:hypothetical protein [Archangium violaceum]|uniref:hypothetical protein n=1 Tax=Archangium violaceum TaxID=83451 RepID=UPI001EF08B63|nr:hypothetical protein [Archangium violaceum]
MLTDRVDGALLGAAPHLRAISNVARPARSPGERAPGGAALDVTAPEPLPPDCPMAVDNLLAALEGRKPPHCVNPELFT